MHISTETRQLNYQCTIKGLDVLAMTVVPANCMELQKVNAIYYQNNNLLDRRYYRNHTVILSLS